MNYEDPYFEKAVELCDRIAGEAHQGQTREFGEDKGKPYKIHPDRVAGTFHNAFMICVAKLHDVIEDTDWTAADLLKEGVDEEIVQAVLSLTKREGENYYHFIMRIRNDPQATIVKIADIEDNMRDLKEGSLKDKYRLARHILKGRR